MNRCYYSTKINKKSKYWIDGIERPITTIINSYIPDIFRICYTYGPAYFPDSCPYIVDKNGRELNAEIGIRSPNLIEDDEIRALLYFGVKCLAINNNNVINGLDKHINKYTVNRFSSQQYTKYNKYYGKKQDKNQGNKVFGLDFQYYFLKRYPQDTLLCQIVALIASSYNAYSNLLNNKTSICNFVIPWEYTQICKEINFSGTVNNNNISNKLSNVILVGLYKLSEVSNTNMLLNNCGKNIGQGNIMTLYDNFARILKLADQVFEDIFIEYKYKYNNLECYCPKNYMSQASFDIAVELEEQYNKNKHNNIPPSPNGIKLYISFIKLVKTDLISDSTSTMHKKFFQNINVQDGLKEYFKEVSKIIQYNIKDSYKILTKDKLVGSVSIIPYNEQQIILKGKSIDFRASADFYYIPGFYYIESKSNNLVPTNFDPNNLSEGKFIDNDFFKYNNVSENMVIYVILIQQYFNLHITWAKHNIYNFKDVFEIPKFPDMVSSVKNDPNIDFDNTDKNNEVDIYSFYIAAFNRFGKTNKYKIVLVLTEEFQSIASFMPCLFKLIFPTIGDKDIGCKIKANPFNLNSQTITFKTYTSTGHSWIVEYNNLKWANVCFNTDITSLSFQYRSLGDLVFSNLNDSTLWSDSIISKNGNLPIPLITGRTILENVPNSNISKLNNIYNSLVITSNVTPVKFQNTIDLTLEICDESLCSGSCINPLLLGVNGLNNYSSNDISCHYLYASQSDNNSNTDCTSTSENGLIYYYISPLNPYSLTETLANIKYINDYITSSSAIDILYSEFINASYSIIAREYNNEDSATGIGGYTIIPEDKNNIDILPNTSNIAPNRYINKISKQSNAIIKKPISSSNVIYGYGNAYMDDIETILNTDYDIISGTLMRLWGEVADFTIIGNINFSGLDKTVNIRGYYLPTVVNFYYDCRFNTTYTVNDIDMLWDNIFVKGFGPKYQIVSKIEDELTDDTVVAVPYIANTEFKPHYNKRLVTNEQKEVDSDDNLRLPYYSSEINDKNRRYFNFFNINYTTSETYKTYLNNIHIINDYLIKKNISKGICTYINDYITNPNIDVELSKTIKNLSIGKLHFIRKPSNNKNPYIISTEDSNTTTHMLQYSLKNIKTCLILEINLEYSEKEKQDNFRHTVFIEYNSTNEINTKYNIAVSGSEYINVNIENIENNKLYFNVLDEYTLSINIKYIDDSSVDRFAIYNAYIIGNGSSLKYSRNTPCISVSPIFVVRNPVDYSKFSGTCYQDNKDGNISRMFSLVGGSTIFNIGLKSILPQQLVSQYTTSWKPKNIQTPGVTTEEQIYNSFLNPYTYQKHNPLKNYNSGESTESTYLGILSRENIPLYVNSQLSPTINYYNENQYYFELFNYYIFANYHFMHYDISDNSQISEIGEYALGLIYNNNENSGDNGPKRYLLTDEGSSTISHDTDNKSAFKIVVPPLYTNVTDEIPDQYKKNKTANINMEFLPSIELKPCINYSDYFDKYFGKAVSTSLGNFYLTVNCNLSILDIVFTNIVNHNNPSDTNKIHLNAEIKLLWSPQNNSNNSDGNPLTYIFTRSMSFYINNLQTITNINKKTIGPIDFPNSIILKGISSNAKNKLFLSYSFFNILDNPTFSSLTNNNNKVFRYLDKSTNPVTIDTYKYLLKYWLVGFISGSGVSTIDTVENIGVFDILNMNTPYKIKDYVTSTDNENKYLDIRLPEDKELCFLQQIQYLRFGDRYSLSVEMEPSSAEFYISIRFAFIKNYDKQYNTYSPVDNTTIDSYTGIKTNAPYLGRNLISSDIFNRGNSNSNILYVEKSASNGSFEIPNILIDNSLNITENETLLPQENARNDFVLDPYLRTKKPIFILISFKKKVESTNSIKIKKFKLTPIPEHKNLFYFYYNSINSPITYFNQGNSNPLSINFEVPLDNKIVDGYKYNGDFINESYYSNGTRTLQKGLKILPIYYKKYITDPIANTITTKNRDYEFLYAADIANLYQGAGLDTQYTSLILSRNQDFKLSDYFNTNFISRKNMFITPQASSIPIIDKNNPTSYNNTAITYKNIFNNEHIAIKTGWKEDISTNLGMTPVKVLRRRCLYNTNSEEHTINIKDLTLNMYPGTEQNNESTQFVEDRNDLLSFGRNPIINGQYNITYPYVFYPIINISFNYTVIFDNSIDNDTLTKYYNFKSDCFKVYYLIPKKYQEKPDILSEKIDVNLWEATVRDLTWTKNNETNSYSNATFSIVLPYGSLAWLTILTPPENPQPDASKQISYQASNVTNDMSPILYQNYIERKAEIFQIEGTNDYYAEIIDTRHATDNVDQYLKNGSTGTTNTILNPMKYRMTQDNIMPYGEGSGVQNIKSMDITGRGIGNLFMADCEVTLTASHITQETINIQFAKTHWNRIKYFLYQSYSKTEVTMDKTFFNIAFLNKNSSNNYLYSYNLNYKGTDDPSSTSQALWNSGTNADTSIEYTLISKNYELITNNLITNNLNTFIDPPVIVFSTKGLVAQSYILTFSSDDTKISLVNCTVDNDLILVKKINFSGISRPYLGDTNTETYYFNMDYGGIMNADRIRKYPPSPIEDPVNPDFQYWIYYYGDSFKVNASGNIVQQSEFKVKKIYPKTTENADQPYINYRTNRSTMFKEQGDTMSSWDNITDTEDYFAYYEPFSPNIDERENMDIIEQLGDKNKQIGLDVTFDNGGTTYPPELTQDNGLEFIIPNLIKPDPPDVPKDAYSFGTGVSKSNDNFCPESVFLTSSRLFTINYIKLANASQNLNGIIENNIYLQNQTNDNFFYTFSNQYKILHENIQKNIDNTCHVRDTPLTGSNHVLIAIRSQDSNNEVFKYSLNLQKYRAYNSNNTKLGIQTSSLDGSPYKRYKNNDTIDDIFKDNQSIVVLALVPEYMIVSEKNPTDDTTEYCYAINYLVDNKFDDLSAAIQQSFSITYDPCMLSAYSGNTKYETDITSSSYNDYVGILNNSKQNIRMKQQLIHVPYKLPIHSPDNILEYFIPTTIKEDISGSYSDYSYMVKLRNISHIQKINQMTSGYTPSSPDDQDQSGLIVAYTWFSNKTLEDDTSNTNTMNWQETLDALTPYYIAIYTSNALAYNPTNMPNNNTYILPVQPLIYTKSYNYTTNDIKWDKSTFKENTLNNNPFPYFVDYTNGIKNRLTLKQVAAHEKNCCFYTDPSGYYDIFLDQNNAKTTINIMYLTNLSSEYQTTANYLNYKNTDFYYCAMNYRIESIINVTNPEYVKFYDTWDKDTGEPNKITSILDFYKNYFNDTYCSKLYLYTPTTNTYEINNTIPHQKNFPKLFDSNKNAIPNNYVNFHQSYNDPISCGISYGSIDINNLANQDKQPYLQEIEIINNGNLFMYKTNDISTNFNEYIMDSSGEIYKVFSFLVSRASINAPRKTADIYRVVSSPNNIYLINSTEYQIGNDTNQIEIQDNTISPPTTRIYFNYTEEKKQGILKQKDGDISYLLKLPDNTTYCASLTSQVVNKESVEESVEKLPSDFTIILPMDGEDNSVSAFDIILS